MTLEELVKKINETTPSWFDDLPEDIRRNIEKTNMEFHSFTHRGTKYKLETIMSGHGIDIEELCNTPVNVILTLFDLHNKIDELCTTLDEIASWYGEMPPTDY